MKKRILMILLAAVLVSTIFAACNKDVNDDTTTTEDNGYAQNADEYELVIEDVTNKDGEAVTDKDGNNVTEVHTVKVSVPNVSTTKNDDGDTDSTSGFLTRDEDSTKTTEKTTTAKPVDSTTNPVLTTLEAKKDNVPSTSDTGRAVDFSSTDQNIIKSMLEVPYLYEASYENNQSVPTNAATHVAIWMIERHNMSTNIYPSQTVVLDLFKYFGRTVVNFKTLCNSDGNNANITYNTNTDSFTITSLEEYTHSVSITKIEDLGNNNYYKVTGKVTGAKGIDKVVAVVQKNKLDSSLGFSIKALKWS